MNRKVKKVVYKILQEYELAREDDCYLIMRVVEILEPHLSATAFTTVMMNLKYKGISFESITRARRKFFEENPEYKPMKITEIRKKEEQKYIEQYSNHIPSIL